MRYLPFLAAVLASAPACAAEVTHKIELPPGFVERWQAPRPFKNVIIGNTDIVDALPGHTQELIIITKPNGGTTNVVLLDEDGKLVANVLVTNPVVPSELARSAVTGHWQVYRSVDECSPACVRGYRDKPSAPAPKKEGG